jgi:glycosyltransferase involved in cell wall biosynthesis
VHWCFDLYPEAIAADSRTVAAPLVAAARTLMGHAYRQCDAVVDLGPQMRTLLEGYGGQVRRETLVPWALTEPARPPAADPAIRAALFGDARLGLLYSGTMGRAHDFETLLALARACRVRSGRTISFCFACRGNRADELRQALRPDDDNISLAPFAVEAELGGRLAAADLHMVSLRPEWAGVVVPSKFFASLAMGRPVVYAGPARSEIARWVRELDVGFPVGEGVSDLQQAVDRLHQFAASPADLMGWQEKARQAYARHFSRQVINDRWDALLRDVMAARAPAGPPPIVVGRRG